MSRGTALLVGGLGLLGTAITAQGIRKFATFDQAMTESLAIMGDVSQTMEEDMANAARNMARQTIFSADQAAESYFFLASAGLDAEESMQQLPQVAAFAQAGLFDMARATELATDAQSALGLSVEDNQQNLTNLKRVTDTLVKANTLANATVEQFSESLTNRAAPRLRQLNKEIEEGVSALAVFADQGIKGRRAGTLLDMTLRELNRRARENEDAFADMNIQVFNQQGEMRNLADIFADMEVALEGLSTKTRSAELAQLGFQQRSIRGILALLGQSEALREYQRELEKAGGITQEVADKQLDTIIKQLGILGSELSDIFIAFGSIFGPEVQRGIESTINFIRDMREVASTTAFAVKELSKELDELEPDNLRPPESQGEAALGTVEPLRREMLNREDITPLLNALNEIPQPFRKLAASADFNRKNLKRLVNVAGNLPPRALEFVDNLSQAEAVMRQLNQGAPTLTAALLQAGVSAERLFGGLEDSRSEIEKLGGLPEDAEKRQKLIDDMTSGADNLLALTEARREAEKDVTNQVGQLKGLRSNLNMALDDSIDLTEKQEAAVQDTLNAVNALLEEIIRAPLVKKIEAASTQADNLQSALGLVGKNISTSLVPFGDLLGTEKELASLLDNDNLKLGERLQILNQILGVRQAINQALSVEPSLVTRGPRGETEFQRRARKRRERRGGAGIPQPFGQKDFVGINEELESPESTDAAEQAGEKNANAFAEAFSDNKRQMARIGADLIVSLAQGANSATDILKSTILSIMRIGIQSVIMGFFGIASPSKMMIGFGKNITLGLAEGIANEQSRVKDAWMGVLNEVTRPNINMGAGQIMQTPNTGVFAKRAQKLTPGIEVRVDVSNLPEARTPFDVIRDSDWQRILRDSIDVSVQEGFDPSRKRPEVKTDRRARR